MDLIAFIMVAYLIKVKGSNLEINQTRLRQGQAQEFWIFCDLLVYGELPCVLPLAVHLDFGLLPNTGFDFHVFWAWVWTWPRACQYVITIVRNSVKY